MGSFIENCQLRFVISSLSRKLARRHSCNTVAWLPETLGFDSEQWLSTKSIFEKMCVKEFNGYANSPASAAFPRPVFTVVVFHVWPVSW